MQSRHLHQPPSTRSIFHRIIPGFSECLTTFIVNTVFLSLLTMIPCQCVKVRSQLVILRLPPAVPGTMLTQSDTL